MADSGLAHAGRRGKEQVRDIAILDKVLEPLDYLVVAHYVIQDEGPKLLYERSLHARWIGNISLVALSPHYLKLSNYLKNIVIFF